MTTHCSSCSVPEQTGKRGHSAEVPGHDMGPSAVLPLVDAQVGRRRELDTCDRGLRR